MFVDVQAVREDEGDLGKKIAKLNKPLVNRIIGHGEEAVDQLLANPLNFRLHPDNQQQALAGAIDDIGFIRSVTVNQRTGRVIDGHLRVTLAARSDVKSLPVEYVDLSEAEEAQALLSLDPIAAMAASDKAKLDELMRAVQSDDERVQQMISELAEREGMQYGEQEPLDNVEHKTLFERFIVPPFSILDARQGYWQERKRAWLSLGIMSELGRGDDGLARKFGQDLMKGENSNFAVIGGSLLPLDPVKRQRQAADKRSNITGAPKMPDYADIGMEYIAPGTSIFDPVLCELVYRWFMPNDGRVLDPFAGGSVRGIVAGWLGHAYTGIDLRPEQVAANEVQAAVICKDNTPRWITGDSRDSDLLIPADERFDLIFSCPPYFDLELYSDDEKDLSNSGDYSEFITAYREIVAKAVARLNDNRFACFVVGDIRDKKGFYRNFVSDTISAFQDASMMLYNEAILVTAVGSLPIRAGKQFQSGRKLGKTHQNVLVFYKGDPKVIKQFGDVEAGDITQPDDTE